MTTPSRTPRCSACSDGVAQPFPFSMAFQPIVDVQARRVFAYEALVRGPGDQSAYAALQQVTPENRYSFDQHCRVVAITLAQRLRLPETGAMLSINFMPGAVYSPSACIQLTLKTAQTVGFPLDRLIFELTEEEKTADSGHLQGIVNEYRRHGFSMALDDFGAGYSGMNLLADLRVQLVKLDMHLIRGIEDKPVARKILRAMVELCGGLDTLLVAEGVETEQEYWALVDCGVTLMQGYLLGRPEFESLPGFSLPRTNHFAMAARTKSMARGNTVDSALRVL